MARGRHYAKLSLSNAARLSFSDLCILLFMFLSLCRLCVCVFLCSHWSLVDVPLIFFCPADHVPDWQPRVLLGMVEARSVNVKKTTTTTIGIQIATKSYVTLQSMAPTNVETVIKPPFSVSRATSIDSDCCRLPTTSVLSNKKRAQITVQNGQADAGRDGRTHLARPNPQAQTGISGNMHSLCSADHEQNWQPYVPS